MATLLKLHEGGDINRSLINNNLAAGMRSGILERSEERPYSYRIARELSPPAASMLRALIRRWEHDWAVDSALELEGVENHTGGNISEDATKVVFDLNFYSYEFEYDPIAERPTKCTLALRPEVVQWLADFTVGDWRLVPGARMPVIFDLEEDAVHFKLRWG